MIKLRRAERQAPRVREIPEVRAQLERDMGCAVSVSLAAKLLGVSSSTMFRHIDDGVVPVVITEKGRSNIPIGALAELYEQVQVNRKLGLSHVLEPVAKAVRQAANRIAADPAINRSAAADPHERSAARSLAYHQSIANKLTRPMADDALHRVWEWRSRRRIDDRYADEWERILALPVREIQAEIAKPGERMRDLRQNSPFAGVLSELERREILRLVT